MNADYYALLTKAIAGKDAAARDKIYNDAWRLIRKSSHLTREAASSHAAALEDAIRRIEDEFGAEDAKSAAEIHAVLSREKNWRSLVITASTVVAIIALSALLYGYVVSKGPVGAGATASSSRASRVRDDVVMADLKSGVDGGSSGEGLPFAFQRQVVFYRTTVVPGSIVVDRENRFLYLIDSNNSARRYGIGIAKECLKGGSFFRITSKLEWPDWKTPGTNIQGADALLASTGPPRQSAGCTRAAAGQAPACSFTARIRPKPLVISSLLVASDW